MFQAGVAQDHHIGAPGERNQGLKAIGIMDVERDGALAAIQMPEEQRVASVLTKRWGLADLRALRRFDQPGGRPMIGKDAARELAADMLAQIEHGQPCEEALRRAHRRAA